jgi:hypothetical protein
MVASQKPSFLNFKVDHMTLLVQPEMYGVAYSMFRIIFGAGPTDILYNKTKEWEPGAGEKSMTFAAMVGNAPEESKAVDKTIIAVVQPTEPAKQPSHVRTMLDGHKAAAHWQHIALRTNDLMTFHKHAEDRGVNFITPILKDEEDDLIQVFSGEWFYPGIVSSGMFFEFLQRNPSEAALKRLEDRNRESWFQDKTFMGLYGEKEREYQSGEVTPFIDFELFESLRRIIGGREVYAITEKDLKTMEETMMNYAAKKLK